ncbi:MAG TPA: hypothetical protein VF530_21735, partial [Planctomycetota bacterium]
MSRSPLKRALGPLRRLLRRRRSPSEQEWLRLILLVRRMQRGQLAVATRLDEVRELTGVVGSFRTDFGTLHDQLTQARMSAEALERGLAERLGLLANLPDAGEERAMLERRIVTLDRLAGRLESIAAKAPGAHTIALELSDQVQRLNELATRIESAAATQGAHGQDELARLHARLQELVDGLARAERAPAPPPPAPFPLEELDQRFMLIGEQLGDVHAEVRKLGPQSDAHLQENMLARLERLATRLEKSGRGRGAGVAPEELEPLLERVAELTARLDGAAAWPASAVPGGAPGPELLQELEELRVQVSFEQEARHASEAELTGLRERLRAAELAKVELETRHATELTQMADHVSRQIQRLEDDLKKKKRGLS